MQRADELTVVHHDDSESRFLDVTYTLARDGLWLITGDGAARHFPSHEVLTTHARRHAA